MTIFFCTLLRNKHANTVVGIRMIPRATQRRILFWLPQDQEIYRVSRLSRPTLGPT